MQIGGRSVTSAVILSTEWQSKKNCGKLIGNVVRSVVTAGGCLGGSEEDDLPGWALGCGAFFGRMWDDGRMRFVGYVPTDEAGVWDVRP